MPDDCKAAEEGRSKNCKDEKKDVISKTSRVIYEYKKLTPHEKRYLLAVEHGDINTVHKRGFWLSSAEFCARILQRVATEEGPSIDVNCVDPLGRSALLMAIDNENYDMLELLIKTGVEPRDALLHAINAHFVEAVELLLEHEEIIHKQDEPHSWEKVDRDMATFNPEITPLILAAHCDNYEILKLLLDRGATLPLPHDVRCGCDVCVKSVEEDCLRHSRSRINAYRALSSPSLICLSSVDPILTAFELSWELRRLSFVENEFKEDYVALRQRCQDFAVALLDHIRSSYELEIILNHDPTVGDEYESGDHMPLARLSLALDYKQKKFVAHPNVQQLMSTLWYEGLPGFRRKNIIRQLLEIIKIGVLFPVYAWIYMAFPGSKSAKLMRKPFVKFINHSFSYLFFLLLLILASQRIEVVVIELFGTEKMKADLKEALRKQRGQTPSMIEWSILIYVVAHIWAETREFWCGGLKQYFQNMWNIIDFTRNSLYVFTAGLRLLAYIQAQQEIAINPEAEYIPREEWNAFDPTLIAEGLFAAGNVFAALKLVHIFSINPHLGPLQISLGRMVIDIIKFFFIYTLVLFAFACGLNQLLWYHADLERQRCYEGTDEPNWDKQRDSCLAWRRFSNLFESSQSLFWASFGLIDLANFELAGIKSYTRFWGLLMFGSYSVINVVVLLNLLIAMMNHSYQIISERSDTEWKFARTKLFMNYFQEGGTLTAPFNILPTVKLAKKLLGIKKRPEHCERNLSIRRTSGDAKDRNRKYVNVMKNLVWRYVTAQHRSLQNTQITEDHVNEIRQDISTFRFDMINLFQKNGMSTSGVKIEKSDAFAKKFRDRERLLLKDFNIGRVEEGCTDVPTRRLSGDGPKFGLLAKFVGAKVAQGPGSGRWKELISVAAQRSQADRSMDVFPKTESLRNSLDIECGLVPNENGESQTDKPMSGLMMLAKRMKQINEAENQRSAIQQQQPFGNAETYGRKPQNGKAETKTEIIAKSDGRKPSLAEIYGRSQPNSRKPSVADQVKEDDTNNIEKITESQPNANDGGEITSRCSSATIAPDSTTRNISRRTSALSASLVTKAEKEQVPRKSSANAQAEEHDINNIEKISESRPNLDDGAEITSRRSSATTAPDLTPANISRRASALSDSNVTKPEHVSRRSSAAAYAEEDDTNNIEKVSESRQSTSRRSSATTAPESTTASTSRRVSVVSASTVTKSEQVTRRSSAASVALLQNRKLSSASAKSQVKPVEEASEGPRVPASEFVEELKSRLQTTSEEQGVSKTSPKNRRTSVKSLAPPPPPAQTGRDRAKSSPSSVDIESFSTKQDIPDSTTTPPSSPCPDTGYTNLAYVSTEDESMPLEGNIDSSSKTATDKIDETSEETDHATSTTIDSSGIQETSAAESELVKSEPVRKESITPDIQISPAPTQSGDTSSTAVESDKWPLLKPASRVQGVSTIKRHSKLGAWL